MTSYLSNESSEIKIMIMTDQLWHVDYGAKSDLKCLLPKMNLDPPHNIFTTTRIKPIERIRSLIFSWKSELNIIGKYSANWSPRGTLQHSFRLRQDRGIKSGHNFSTLATLTEPCSQPLSPKEKYLD